MSISRYNDNGDGDGDDEGPEPLTSRRWNGDAKWPDRFRTWRDRDLESSRVTTARAGRGWTNTTDLRSAAHRELVRENTDLGEGGALAEELAPHKVPDEACTTLLTNVAEVSHLLRALAWVQQSSQSTRVAAYVGGCMDQVHSNLPTPTGTSEDPTDWQHTGHWRDGILMVTTWCIVSSILNNRPRRSHLSLLTGADDGLADATELRRASNAHTGFPEIASLSLLQHLSPILLRLLTSIANQIAPDASNISPASL